MLDYFQGEPWPAQSQSLRELESAWDSHDVFVIQAPVASGKSKMADCLLRWATGTKRVASGLIVANNNLLVEQYLSAVRGYGKLHRGDSYWCAEHEMPCVERKAETDKYCRAWDGNVHSPDSCSYVSDLRLARGPRKLVVNQHVFLAHKLYRELQIFDEAHSLEHTVADMSSVTLWRSQYRWPSELRSIGDVSKWLAGYPGVADERLEALDDFLSGRSEGKYTVALGSDLLRGRPTDFVRLLPLSVADRAGVLWPSGKTRKVVLMSATIGTIDVKQLGLSGRRVCYLRSESSIPAANRPIQFTPVADMSFRNREQSIPLIASHLVDVLLPAHPGERGLIHASYETARRLREEIGGNRRLHFHSNSNKAEQMERWLRGELGENAVLVGSGMHEGLDLRDDLARWQAFVETPRPSLGDPGMAWLAENDPERYEWLTVRELAQGSGRVCRHPGDRGVTYMLDSSSRRELKSKLIPEWMREAIEWGVT